VPAKFVVKKGTTGKFRFNLLSTNGKAIATSETYETKRACLAGIESVRKNAPNATIDDQTERQGASRSQGRSSIGRVRGKA
jgi:uncharacterized protein YegP (UPF0339 family)